MKAFIDFEASSLSPDGYPIEVAWVLEDGTSESYLIRPETPWTDWDAASQDIHGITRDVLARDGLAAADVARRLHQVLGGCDTYCDAPAADGKWLAVLLRSAGLETLPLLHLYDAYRAIFEPLVSRLPAAFAVSLAQSVVRRAEESIDAIEGVRHRAEPDARRLYEKYLAVKALAADTLEGWP